jgi:hypothetical protein
MEKKNALAAAWLTAMARCTHAWSVSRDVLGHCSCDVGYCSCDGGNYLRAPGATAAGSYEPSTDAEYACYCAAISFFYVGLPLLALAGVLRISWPWFVRLCRQRKRG